MRAHEVEKKRNIIIHSGWSTSGELDAATRDKMTAKDKGKKLRFEVMKVEDLASIAEEIKFLVADCSTFMHELITKDKVNNPPLQGNS